MDKNYLLLGQLYKLLSAKNPGVSDLERFFEKSGYDINYQIPDGSWVIKRKPEWLGYTFLHITVKCKGIDGIDVIKLLLSRGADFTQKDGNGFTPLRLAFEIEKDAKRKVLSTRITLPALDLLLLAHTKSNDATNPSCNDGISHFHIACMTDNVPLARLFLQAGVSVNQNVNETSHLFPGWTPLHFAVRYGNKDLVQLLLTCGADIHRLDGNGLSPLCLLVQRSIEINNWVFLENHKYDKAMVESESLRNDTLIDLFIQKNIHENAISDIGLSFFHVSCTMRNTNLFKRFIELGADVNSRVNSDSPIWPAYTALHFAAHCNPKIFKLLVEEGADILVKDAKGKSAFDLLVQRHDPTDVCDVLKSKPILERIQFENGTKLVEVLSAMRHTYEFDRFIGKINVNTRLPEDSPLWPSYTLAHLAVALGKVTYRFRHDYFVKKNWFVSKSFRYRNDNDSFIKTCLKYQPILTIRDINGMTPLHLAFHSHKKKNVDQILQEIETSCYAENCVDRGGLSHLHIACIADNPAVVGKFLKRGFDPDSPTRNDLTWRDSNGHLKSYRAGYTLYHIAAANKSGEMIDTIRIHKAKTNLLNADGLTAAQVGFLDNFTDTRLLLPHLEIENTNHTAANAGGLSHLHIACYIGDFDLVEELVSVVADVEASIDCKTALDSYAKQLAPYAGWTPLHFAVKKFDGSDWFCKIVDLLISKGADLHERNAAGLNPLNLALLDFDYNDGADKMYREIKEKGGWRNDFGLTRLHLACFCTDKEEIESLLKSGLDVNRQIDANSPIWPGDTAMHILMDQEDFNYEYEKDVIKLLLKHGADLTLQNAKNCTPLHVFWNRQVSEGTEFIDMVMEADSHFYEANPTDDNGESHFHISCMIGNVDIVQKFIDSGVNINEQICPFSDLIEAGSTPIHLAPGLNEEVTELLLKRGVDLKLVDSRGLTAVQATADNYLPTTLATFFRNAQIDIQAPNIFGETTLGILLKTNWQIEPSVIQNILDCGIRINFVDPPAKKEDIARTAFKLDNDAFRVFVEMATDVTNIDANGQNVVHSIGSLILDDGVDKTNRLIRCALNVKLWLDRGCDLDLRDKNGRTPLHYAAETGDAGVFVLLLLGADVNVRDNQGLTPFSYIKNDDRSVRSLFLAHILMMACSGLDLVDSLHEILRSEYDDESEDRRDYNIYLASMNDVTIVDGISLRHLLTEKVVQNFSRLHVSKREIILKYLEPENLSEQFDVLGSWVNLLQFQYQKILQRSKLLEPATISFHKNVYHLPLECIDMILQNLSNQDLTSLIKV